MKKLLRLPNLAKIALSLTFIFTLMTANVHGQETKTIIGAGASFPYPLYAKMFGTYYQQKNVRVNYQSIGSGGGVRQLLAHTIEFGATDAFLSDAELDKVHTEQGQTIIHIPIVLGAVAVTYNVAGVRDLKLNGQLLAEIFMGKVERWNDEQIATLNPGAKLPSRRIIVVRRSDGAGTTSVFSDFLAYSSDSWKNNVGVGKSLNWYRGSIGAKGNEGVTGQIKNIPGAIGYVSLNYAIQAKLPVVAVENAAGNHIKPTVKSVSEAAEGDLPPDTRISLSGRPTMGTGYPISTFTWIIYYHDQDYNDRSIKQAAELKELLTWMVTRGQSQAMPLHYAPLSPSARSAASRLVQDIRYKRAKL